MSRRFILALILFCLPILACNTLIPPRPPVAWDPDPKVLIISADTCCGMMYDPNGMATARLWGDGRLLWVAGKQNGSRQVLTATLTTSQMQTLLQSFVDTGFFGLKDTYQPNYTVNDAPETCMSANLTSTSKTVCDLLGQAPAKFYNLMGSLATVAAGADYVPAKGYLQASPTGPNPGVVVPQWPAQTAGLSLKDAGGVWVEGSSLAAAWQAVNAQPLNPVVQDGDTNYSLTLLIPDVTRQQPPTPQP